MIQNHPLSRTWQNKTAKMIKEYILHLNGFKTQISRFKGSFTLNPMIQLIGLLNLKIKLCHLCKGVFAIPTTLSKDF